VKLKLFFETVGRRVKAERRGRAKPLIFFRSVNNFDVFNLKLKIEKRERKKKKKRKKKSKRTLVSKKTRFYGVTGASIPHGQQIY